MPLDGIMRGNTIIIKLGPMRVGVLSRAEPVVEMTGHRSVYRLPRLLTVKLRKIIKLECCLLKRVGRREGRDRDLLTLIERPFTRL